MVRRWYEASTTPGLGRPPWVSVKSVVEGEGVERGEEEGVEESDRGGLVDLGGDVE